MNCRRRLAMSILCDCVEGLLLCEAVASSSMRTDCEVVGVGGVGVAVAGVAAPSESASICSSFRRFALDVKSSACSHVLRYDC